MNVVDLIVPPYPNTEARGQGQIRQHEQLPEYRPKTVEVVHDLTLKFSPAQHNEKEYEHEKSVGRCAREERDDDGILLTDGLLNIELSQGLIFVAICKQLGEYINNVLTETE